VRSRRVGAEFRRLRENALLGHYVVSDPDHREYLEWLARGSNKQGWWQDYGDTIPPYYADFIGLEADASYIKTWEPTSIPGLLQMTEGARPPHHRGR